MWPARRSTLARRRRRGRPQARRSGWRPGRPSRTWCSPAAPLPQPVHVLAGDGPDVRPAVTSTALVLRLVAERQQATPPGPVAELCAAGPGDAAELDCIRHRCRPFHARMRLWAIRPPTAAPTTHTAKSDGSSQGVAADAKKPDRPLVIGGPLSSTTSGLSGGDGTPASARSGGDGRPGGGPAPGPRPSASGGHLELSRNSSGRGPHLLGVELGEDLPVARPRRVDVGVGREHRLILDEEHEARGHLRAHPARDEGAPHPGRPQHLEHREPLLLAVVDPAPLHLVEPYEP